MSDTDKQTPLIILLRRVLLLAMKLGYWRRKCDMYFQRRSHKYKVDSMCLGS